MTFDSSKEEMSLEIGVFAKIKLSYYNILKS